MRTFLAIRLWISALLLAGIVLPAQAATPARVALLDSIKPVELAPQTGPVNPHKPFISRTVLTAEESAAPLDFEVTLKMRNFSELQARVARGELISPQEMVVRYEPLAADYDAVAAWITGLGLIITRPDQNHVALFVRGNISQIQEALQLSFARVTFEGKEYTSATDAPTVPETLASILVGINGLQPHIRPHKHLIVKPNSLTGTNPPFLPRRIMPRACIAPTSPARDSQ